MANGSHGGASSSAGKKRPASSPLSPVLEEDADAIALAAPGVGDTVVVLNGSDMYGRFWHPATVLEVLADQHCCVVEYDLEGAARGMVDWRDIRPRSLAVELEEDEIEHPPAASSFFFEAGDRVELLRCHPDYGDAWYPATVKGVLDPETCTYVVAKMSLVGGKLCLGEEEYQEQGLANFRPQVVESEWCMLDLRPGAEVEACCDGVWAIGVVLGDVDQSRVYEIAIGEEISMTKEIKDLRPRHKWDWNSREWSVPTSSSLVGSEKRPRSSVKKACNDYENNYDSEYSAPKKPRKEWQQLDVKLDGSEHSSVSNTDNVSGNTRCVLRKKVSTKRIRRKERHEGQCNSRTSLLEETTMQLSTMDTHGCLLDDGRTATINSSCQANRNEANEAASRIPFVKSLPAWSTFEEMEVLKKMPQQPHFGPLQRQLPALREGVALGLMGVFANLVQNIRKLSVEDSDESFEEKNCVLSLLEHNGFSVGKLKICLSKLTEIKSEYAKHIEEKDGVQAQKLLKRDSCSRLDSLRAKKMKAVAKLLQKVRQVEEEIKHARAELSELEEVEIMVNRACYDIEKLFGDILADYLG